MREYTQYRGIGFGRSTCDDLGKKYSILTIVDQKLFYAYRLKNRIQGFFKRALFLPSHRNRVASLGPKVLFSSTSMAKHRKITQHYPMITTTNPYFLTNLT